MIWPRCGGGVIYMSNVIQMDLNKLLSKAYTYENRAGHSCEHLETTYVGSVERGKRIYDVYIDSRGNSWFLMRFKTDHGIVSEYEKVFGHPEPTAKRTRRKTE